MPTSKLGAGTVAGAAYGDTGVSLDMAAVQDGLKELYGRANWLTALYEHDGLFTRMPKFEGFTGSYYPVVTQYAANARRSQDFAYAQSNTSTFKVEKHLVHRVRDYAMARLDTESILSSRGDAGAFANYLDVEVSGARYALRRSLARGVYGDGSGQIGTCGTVVASDSDSVTAGNQVTITLNPVGDVVNFEVGQQLSFIDTTAFGNAKSGTNEVIAVDRSLGKIVVTSTGATDALRPETADFIFMYGDLADTAANFKRISGLDAWVPATAPVAGDSFFGVDRSVDVTRMAGHRFTGSTTDVYHAFVSASEVLGREGGKPDHIFCDYATYTSLMKEASSGGGHFTNASGANASGAGMTQPTNKGLRVDIGMGKTLELGFTNIVIHLPSGPVSVVPDPDCPANTAYMLKLSDWELASLGMAPQILDLDGQSFLRISDRDAMEIRLGFFGNVICKNAGNQSRIDFS